MLLATARQWAGVYQSFMGQRSITTSLALWIEAQARTSDR
jgi:hypothetical protein